MSEIALTHHESGIAEEEAHVYTSTGTPMGKVFMWLFLCQDALMFMGLFAAYLSVRIGLGHLWPSPNNAHIAGMEHYPLDINLTAVNTFILICSSVTMVMAVQAAQAEVKKGLVKWLLLTAFGGAIFLGVQVYEYRHLIGEDGMGMGKSLFDATFFSLTGFHGLHVFSGGSQRMLAAPNSDVCACGEAGPLTITATESSTLAATAGAFGSESR